MKLDKITYEALRRDLSLDLPFAKGLPRPVRRCWHFYTNGRDIDMMF